MRTLNLGILAHVDAGKTTLTERLLYAAGVIDEIGSVDDGSTQTDTLALERQRGITIKSAVVSFVIDDVTVNLIDTPGHPDFIAEVERVLSVLDGAVLVISAVEGVQSQTRVLMRTLQRLRIPTLIFVNKIDRGGAQHEGVLQAIAEKLTPAIIPMGSARGLGTRSPGFTPYGAGDVAFTAALADLLAEHDDALLAAYVDGETSVSYCELRGELAAQTRQALVHPVYFGSAITGAGVDALTAGITELLPAAEGAVDGPVSGTVFKVERGPAGEKIAYVRMFSGTVRTRDRLQFGREDERKVTAIRVFDRGLTVQRPSVVAGQIAKLWGLGDIRIGDAIGASRTTAEGHLFAPPTLESVIVPRRLGDKGALQVALAQLAEQDPLINLRQDDVRQELFVSLYGEVQKEVIQATLANDFNIDVEFRETTTICIERPFGTSESVEVLYAKTKTNVTGNSSPISSNPFLATVGLRLDPAPIGSGIEFRLDVDVRLVPIYIYKTVDTFVDHMGQYVRETLQEGLFGWQVTDCTVTMIDSGYRAPGSTAADFRKLTPLVLMSALKQAGTTVYEPMQRFHLEIPPDTFGATVPVLARLRAVPQTQEMRGSAYVLEGEIPAARVHELQQQLPMLTRGEGVLDCAFDRYQPVDGTIPTRPRTDHNPLDRKEYLLHVVRRV
ncbi:MAG: TetM/TetW/TetO/TetS family tetracycline resistance ribosomal protection protein [Chloroflexota bacterium]|nr:TetM/TetW/TetO/TetS family tetracycline resistance ribosomal protection protein [Chloroflexota bacterium]